jgi:hypothetical protein
MSALTTHTHIVTREKRKRKEKNKKTLTSDRKPNKGTERDHLKKTSLGPLRQGPRFETSETKTMLKQRAQTIKPKLENHKELPLHTCKLPQNQCNSPWTNACEPPHEKEQLHQLSSHRSDWSPSPVRPVDKIAEHLRTTLVRPVALTGQADATWETARAQK